MKQSTMMQYWTRIACISQLLFLACFLGCGKAEQDLPEWVNPLLDAKKALAAGDKETAKQALMASIETKPSVWAYMELAKLKLAEGDTDGADADCEKALELEPANRDIKWLIGEIKKPESKRFKGRYEYPPSYSK